MAFESHELSFQLTSRIILGIPLVFSRDSGGRPFALLDRCPHRNAPLSIGENCRDRLRCAYHGWEFNFEGKVTAIPGSEQVNDRASVESFPVIEQQGWIWVWLDPTNKPSAGPFTFFHMNEEKYSFTRSRMTLKATLFTAAENILDVTHTAFVHRRLFRNTPQNLRHEIHATDDQVEVEYIGEPRPSGWLARLLAPKGGEVKHLDRFIAPNLAQVEYRLEDRHLLITNALTPTSGDDLDLFSVVAFKLGHWNWIGWTFGQWIGRRILEQDCAILEVQSKNIQRFGGEKFMFTDADPLGPHIARLLRVRHLYGDNQS